MLNLSSEAINRLQSLQCLRDQAEKEAEEHYIATMFCHDPDGLHDSPTWDEMAETSEDPEDYTRTLLVDTFMALLTNPSRHQSRHIYRHLLSLAGHDMGTEDRPEVLVWSLISVMSGGYLLVSPDHGRS